VLRFVVVVGSLLMLAACGAEPRGPAQQAQVRAAPGGVGVPTATDTAGPEMRGTGVESPPPFRLRYDGRELVLRPHTWCYENGCVDGVAPDPPLVGSPAEIRVHVPIERWDLSVSFRPAAQPCGRAQTVEPARDEDGWYVLRPAGHAGSYDVELFAQDGGDMVAGFRWDTPADGPLAVPEARLALIADNDGTPDSYGVELALVNLAETPRSAQARITVTAANGRSLRFDAARAVDHCLGEGTVYFDGPDDDGLAAARLGDFPFRYDVEVRLDGVTYQATADYPADEIVGNEPSVRLRFTPALPSLS
jgi:hypothetical protein